jgi:Flp pilus assembly protein TadG
MIVKRRKSPRPAQTGWRLSRRLSRRRPGIALIEFAFVVPLLILLLLGIIEFGWLVHNQLQVANAAREGARSAALGDPVAKIRQRTIAAGYPAIPSSCTGTTADCSIELKWSNQEDGSDNYPNTVSDSSDGTVNAVPARKLIRVTVNVPYHSLTGLTNFLNRSLTGVVVMRREASA